MSNNAQDTNTAIAATRKKSTDAMPSKKNVGACDSESTLVSYGTANASPMSEELNDSAATFAKHAGKNGWNAPTATRPSFG
ncbi:hypothetical protein A0H81_08470 [Grifola frondosa]|uniref:Uncharacterized protein n=1 Tax=Grifola frondosa TaxID=5627 RepID=A0A1C7M7X1_GRIFR|nr:hypothetical protein A0H81_08470 [Grifola frondosa]